jgi:anthranilate phosphoribosyltransferase
MIREAIKEIVDRRDLTQDEAAGVMQEIMDGDATPSQIASFITALRMKGETIAEMSGFTKVMREKSIKIPVRAKKSSLIDTCGTGGDRLKTFNVSTTAAFVVAGAGVPVAKHGNRAMSGKCGSADVLESLGVSISLPPAAVGKCIDSVGIGFLFAPSLHPSMKYAVVPRKEIGIRTIFNILGPLTNPASAKRQLIGVYDPDLTELMAGVLLSLGSERAIVAHGLDGIDELSTLGKTKITELRDGRLDTYEIVPEDFGLRRAGFDELAQGETAEESARTVERILDGEQGAPREIVLLNAGAALMVAGKVDSIADGISIAKETIDSGKARNALKTLKKISREFTEN